MKSVRNLTDQNRKALLELPVGFFVQARCLGPCNPSDWEDVQVVSVSVDAEGRRYGGLQVVLSYWSISESKFCFWTLEERLSDYLTYGSGRDVVSVRWSPEAMRVFKQLSGDLVLAQTVASLLVGAR